MKYRNKSKYKRHELLRLRKKLRRNKRKDKKKNKIRLVKNQVGTPRSFRRNNDYNFKQRLAKKETSSRIKKDRLIEKYLPLNFKYLITEPQSPFNLNFIKKENYDSGGMVIVPEEFSIMDAPDKSYLFLKKLISALLIENNISVILDYEFCKKVELSSQVLLDIILKDFWVFGKKINVFDRNKQSLFPSTIGGKNIIDIEIQKLLFSVGSPAILNNKERKFADIIPYKLCAHDNEMEKNLQKRTEQKEIDTTVMADYVIDCLKRMNKKLTGDKLNDRLIHVKL